MVVIFVDDLLILVLLLNTCKSRFFGEVKSKSEYGWGVDGGVDELMDVLRSCPSTLMFLHCDCKLVVDDTRSVKRM